MKFSPKCRTKKLGMIFTIVGSFCSLFNWEGSDIRPQIRPRKIPVFKISCCRYSKEPSQLDRIKAVLKNKGVYSLIMHIFEKLHTRIYIHVGAEKLDIVEKRMTHSVQ